MFTKNYENFYPFFKNLVFRDNVSYFTHVQSLVTYITVSVPINTVLLSVCNPRTHTLHSTTHIPVTVVTVVELHCFLNCTVL